MEQWRCCFCAGVCANADAAPNPVDAKATAVTASKQQQQHVGDDHVDGSNGDAVMILNEAVTAIGELDPWVPHMQTQAASGTCVSEILCLLSLSLSLSLSLALSPNNQERGREEGGL